MRKKLGKKGDVIEVSEGYARNFILPKKIGVEATPKNMNDLKLKKANEEKIAKEQLEAAQLLPKSLETKEVTVSIKSGEGGKTFGSVSSKEIAEAAKAESSEVIAEEEPDDIEDTDSSEEDT